MKTNLFNFRQATGVDRTAPSKPNITLRKNAINNVDSGPPGLIEVCQLTEFLLETISLEMYNETTRIYLPRVFLSITQMLTVYSANVTADDITASLKLCMKIVSRVQPMITYVVYSFIQCSLWLSFDCH